MLAQNFKTAKELGLADVEVDALVTVLRMLEREDIKREEFHMGYVQHECKTPACICGWAYHISRGRAFPELFPLPSPLSPLPQAGPPPSLHLFFPSPASPRRGGQFPPPRPPWGSAF